MLTAREQQAAIDRVGLGQLNALGKQLGEVFGKVAEAESGRGSAPSDVVVGTVTMPCEACPALMTRHEAALYWQGR